MTTAVTLATAFQTGLPAEVRRVPPPASLEAALVRLHAEGRQAWPEISVTAERFAAYLAERLDPDEDVEGALRSVQAADLYLACACTGGDAAALAAFERHFMSGLSAYLQRPSALPAFTDEVKQAVRVRLLVGEGAGLLPRIATYRGRGPLAVWLRLAAVRLAINLRRWEARAGEPTDDLSRLRAPGPDPELEFFRARYQRELSAAVEAALRALSDRDASLLRLHFFERVSVEAVARMHGVSARTVHRWIAEIRQGIIADTRRRLRERCRLSETQLDSVIGLARSEIELSVRRLLGGEGRPA